MTISKGPVTHIYIKKFGCFTPLEFFPKGISAPPPSAGCTCMASIGGLTPFRKEGEDELSLSLAELASVWHLLSSAYMVSFRLRRFELLICCASKTACQPVQRPHVPISVAT